MIKIQPKTVIRPQHEALGNSNRVCGVYSPELRAGVYCLGLNYYRAIIFCQTTKIIEGREPAIPKNKSTSWTISKHTTAL